MKGIPRVPAIDQGLADRQHAREFEWDRTAAQGPEQHDKSQDDNFSDCRADGAEKTPDAIDDRFKERTGSPARRGANWFSLGVEERG
jgi:hypothetical protein